jgi:hypothetical protein
MIKANTGTPIQAYPLTVSTQVFATDVSAFEVYTPLIVHMLADGDITLHYNTVSTPGSIVVPAKAGEDFAIDDYFDNMDVSAACIVTPA